MKSKSRRFSSISSNVVPSLFLLFFFYLSLYLWNYHESVVFVANCFDYPTSITLLVFLFYIQDLFPNILKLIKFKEYFNVGWTKYLEKIIRLFLVSDRAKVLHFLLIVFKNVWSVDENNFRACFFSVLCVYVCIHLNKISQNFRTSTLVQKCLYFRNQETIMRFIQ